MKDTEIDYFYQLSGESNNVACELANLLISESQKRPSGWVGSRISKKDMILVINWARRDSKWYCELKEGLVDAHVVSEEKVRQVASELNTSPDDVVRVYELGYQIIANAYPDVKYSTVFPGLCKNNNAIFLVTIEALETTIRH